MSPRARLEIADGLTIGALIGLFFVGWDSLHGLWPHLGYEALYLVALFARGYVYRRARRQSATVTTIRTQERAP